MMAKKKSGGVNKSQLIRDYVRKNPTHKPKQIEEGLKANKVSYGLIASVLQKHKARRADRRGRTAAAARNGQFDWETRADAAAQFIELSGGVDNALEWLAGVKKTIDATRKLRGK
jgi:hypothetical protein